MKSLKEIKKSGYRDYERPGKQFHAYIYRTLGIYLTYLFQFSPITPNMVSLLGSLFAFLGTIFFALNNSWYFLVGIALFYFAEVLDYVDGTLARTKKLTSKLMWRLFEDFYHEIPRQFVFFFIGLGGYFATNNLTFIFLGILALISQLLTMYLSQLRKAILGSYGIKLISEDPDNPVEQDNPFLQKKHFSLFRLIVLPMRQIKLILLVFVVLSFWIPNVLYYGLYFYAPFLTIRMLMFAVNTYVGMVKVECRLNKKGKTGKR